MNIKELSNLYYLSKEIKQLEEELEEITEIDPKVRLIARLRFIEFKTWYEIADEITPDDKELVDSSTPRKYFQRWLKNNEMSHMSYR